jgi:hypothetical protein
LTVPIGAWLPLRVVLPAAGRHFHRFSTTVHWQRPSAGCCRRTERTNATSTLRDWQSVFDRHGLQLEVLAV